MVDMQNKPNSDRKTKIKYVFKIIAVVLIAAAALTAAVLLTPKLLSMRDAQTRARFAAYVDKLGVYGVLLMFALQLLQVLVSIIPGEPVEVLFGIMYGTIGGMLLCLAGILTASAIIFACVRRFGTRFVDKFTNSKKFDRLKFLQDPIKRDAFLFLLFLIPGTPKDTLVYFAPFTQIKMGRFLFITTFARIPSVITSTYAGANISQGDFFVTVVIFVITGILGAVGIYINSRIIKNENRQYNRKEKRNDEK